MRYAFSEVIQILGTGEYRIQKDGEVRIPLIDSRQLTVPSKSLFFALPGKRQHGRQYIRSLYENGVRFFISDRKDDLVDLSDANFIIVTDPVKALQALATYHRKQFNFPVIGITGSTYKTTLKEWLYELLKSRFTIVKNPGSYNSAFGVPLALLEISDHHNLGIFEAGISSPGEMDELADMILPDLGIITNVDAEFNRNFPGKEELARELAKLFTNSRQYIIPFDCKKFLSIEGANKIITRGYEFDADYAFNRAIGSQKEEFVDVFYRGELLKLLHPFHISNNRIRDLQVACLAAVNALGNFEADLDWERLAGVDLGLRTFPGFRGISLFHDNQSSDLASFRNTLSKLKLITGDKPIWGVFSKANPIVESDGFWRMMDRILSFGYMQEIFVSSLPPADLRLKNEDRFNINVPKSKIITLIKRALGAESAVLVQGDRNESLRDFVYALQDQTHSTVLDVNLSALSKNLKSFENFLNPKTKIMVMVKANAYGAGAVRISKYLSGRRIDYLGVAYVDEGVELRKAGIDLPILVLNVDPQEFELVLDYDLEPELYNFSLLERFENYVAKRGLSGVKVHLKLDTGMHRLGFLETQLSDLIAYFKGTEVLVIQSVFSHLAASDDPEHHNFTVRQIEHYRKMSDLIMKELDIRFDRHILNSGGIVRYPEYQFDMVRLGIGIYGVGMDRVNEFILLTPVHSLKCRISQIKEIEAGETIGYGRQGKLTRPSRIGVISLGYADGLIRLAGNGRFSVLINGHLCPTIGNVCMDMTMIDLTDYPPAKEGDEVVVFNEDHSINFLARAAETIPYEILTNIGRRVQKVFVYD